MYMNMLPILPTPKLMRDRIEHFLGYNRAPDAPAGSFYNTENLSARAYPYLAPRRPRGTLATPAAASLLIPRDPLCYIDGGTFVIGSRRVDMRLTPGEKQAVTFGEYVIILPDRKYIRPADGSWGETDAEASSPAGTRVTLQLCRADGTPLPQAPSETPAENPKGGELWLDTSDLTPTLYRYAPDRERWEAVTETYIRLHARGIGAPFRAGDGITLAGLTPPDLQTLNATHILVDCGEDHLVFRGILKRTYAQTGSVTAARRLPPLDYITTVGDRLWGCFCGRDEESGETVCHIRASRAGDPFNWAGSTGEDGDPVILPLPPNGPFTGACDYLGTPHFFRSHSLHRVTGKRPADFRATTADCDGVEAGSARSLCLVGKTLYYKSRIGIMSYGGDLPYRISSALGETRYRNAAAGAVGETYYISMEEAESGLPHLFSLDTVRGYWHREDATRALSFAALDGELYFIEAPSGRIRTVGGSGIPDRDPVLWMAESHPIEAAPPAPCRLTRLDLRLRLPPASTLDTYIEYDSDGEWHHLATLRGTTRTTLELPLRPRYCDHLRLRFVGRGDCEIISLTPTGR